MAGGQGSLIGGRVLGGSSSINSMLYIRGQPRDYNDWAAAGARGWDWDTLAPYFKKLEDHELGESETRGTGGPLHISYPRTHDAICAAVISAGVAMGLAHKADLNELDQEGIGYFPATIKRGRRVSAASAFLAPTVRRANLTVITDTTALKVIFDGRRAVGVASLRHGVEREFRVRREIVVCAGALQSPKLLQLTGIGPADISAPSASQWFATARGVGMNLRDHWKFRPQYRLLREAGHNHRLRGPWRYLSLLH
jgi:choline dehydrogenase